MARRWTPRPRPLREREASSSIRLLVGAKEQSRQTQRGPTGKAAGSATGARLDRFAHLGQSGAV
jgi:hypothetical protein